MACAKDETYIPGSLSAKATWKVDNKKNILRPQVLIIGTGGMGSEHAEVITGIGEADIVGFYDVNPPSLERAQKIVKHPEQLKIYSSLTEACADPATDTVIIATPNFTHLEVLREVMKYKRNILLEKPVAHNIEDAAEIAKLAENYEAVFLIGFEYRFKSTYREMLYEILERGTLGNVRMMSILEHRRCFYPKWKEWNKFSFWSGGTFVEKCCHYFDLFNLIAQSKPEKVYATGFGDINYHGIEQEGVRPDTVDGGFVIVEYQNGVKANLNLCMFVNKQECKEEFFVNGEKASLYAYDHPFEEIEIKVDRVTPSRRIKINTPEHILEMGGHGGSTYYEHLNFYKAIRGEEYEKVSAVDGLLAVAIGVAAELSIKSGDPIYLKDIVDERFLC